MNWLDYTIWIALIMGILYLYKIGKKDLVSKIILSLVVQAEKVLGSGTGELKYAYVIEKIYAVLPVSIRGLFSKKEIDNMIEGSVKKLKNMLENGKNLHSYTDEKYLNK